MRKTITMYRQMAAQTKELKGEEIDTHKAFLNAVDEIEKRCDYLERECVIAIGKNGEDKANNIAWALDMMWRNGKKCETLPIWYFSKKALQAAATASSYCSSESLSLFDRINEKKVGSRATKSAARKSNGNESITNSLFGKFGEKQARSIRSSLCSESVHNSLFDTIGEARDRRSTSSSRASSTSSGRKSKEKAAGRR